MLTTKYTTERFMIEGLPELKEAHYAKRPRYRPL